jgi:Tfp pilus assembly protein PilV
MRNSKGFSLVEAMTAVAILIISMLAVLNTLVVAIDFNLANVLRDEAMGIGEAQMNTLRNTSFGSLASGSTAMTRSVRKLTVTYTIQWTVNNLSSNSKAIQVLVGWTFKGVSHQMSLSSVVSIDV